MIPISSKCLFPNTKMTKALYCNMNGNVMTIGAWIIFCKLACAAFRGWIVGLNLFPSQLALLHDESKSSCMIKVTTGQTFLTIFYLKMYVFVCPEEFSG